MNKNLNTIVWVVSIFIPVIVAILFGVKLDIALPFDPYSLPKINAILNACTTVTLLTSLYFAKQKNIELHSRLIYMAMLLSTLFLVGYILYHITTEHTRYGGEGAIKMIYLLLLFTHIVLAIILTPFVLFAFLFGFTGQVEKHRRIVKWSFPIWLYVSITGVICYLMIAPYYPH